MSTNFDPYGTRKKLGLPVEEWQHICWPCWEEKGKEKDTRIRKETDEAAAAQGTRCGFLEAWVGHCLNDRPCHRHEQKKCWQCGEPATRNCSVAGSLVCGMPECDRHPHVHQRVA